MRISTKKLLFLGLSSLFFTNVSFAKEIEVYLNFQQGTTEIDVNLQKILNQNLQKFNTNQKLSLSFYYETYSSEMQLQNTFLYNKITQNVLKFSKMQVANVTLEKTDFIEIEKQNLGSVRLLLVINGAEKEEEQAIIAYTSNVPKPEKVLKLPASGYVISPTAYANVEAVSPTLSSTNFSESDMKLEEEERLIDDTKALFMNPDMPEDKKRPIYH